MASKSETRNSPLSTPRQSWWGTFALKEDEAGCWHVGPSRLWIHREAQAWRLVHAEQDDVEDSTATMQVPAPPEAEPPDEASPAVDVQRYSFARTNPSLHLWPALADRPVIVRPEKPLYVLAGEEVTLYVSTPLWLLVEVGDPPRLLREIPSHRPSDTWFGPNTREGELCYAARSAGRLKLAELPRRLHRAVTPVQIRNQAADALLVERLRLPVEYLSLYQAPDDLLWTQAVALNRSGGGDLAALELGEGVPPEAPGARLVRGPRQEARSNLIVRTFSAIFR